MQSLEYKNFHESFMKNNNGTSAFESFLYVVPSSFAIFHSITVTSILKLSNNNVPVRFLVEFIIICFSLVLCLTIFNDMIGHIVITLLLITFTSIIRQLQGKCHLTPFVSIPSIMPDFITGKKQQIIEIKIVLILIFGLSISVGRSIISLITAVCILAVDFQCFPRKLAKTEKFGFGELEDIFFLHSSSCLSSLLSLPLLLLPSFYSSSLANSICIHSVSFHFSIFSMFTFVCSCRRRNCCHILTKMINREKSFFAR